MQFIRALACIAIGTSVLAAQTTPAAKPIEIPIQQYTLPNGLRVVLSVDHSAPTYAICITYNVGSRDEKPGRTGFAHLFEHMMFQGSQNVGKGEMMILVENNGGDMNGTTNEDRTNYFEAFPANQLDLGLFLESDRMRSLAINQANLNNQRNAVQEERRIGVDNRAYGKTEEVMQDTIYDNFAYKHSTIGSMEDLNAAKVEDVSAFFKTYYAPNNAVLTLVGDFQPDEALAKVKKYFGDIPSQKAPPEPDMAEPQQKAERRKTIDDGFAQMPRIDIAYKIPAGNTSEWYSADVLGNILGYGQSSRLYQTLVKDKQLAVNARVRVAEMRGPATVEISITPRPGKDLKEVEQAVYAEIDKLKASPPETWEMQKAYLERRTGVAFGMESTLSRAIMLGRDSVYYHDPAAVNTRLSKIAAVTKDDVQKAANRYLTEANRTVVITMPKAGTAPKGDD